MKTRLILLLVIAGETLWIGLKLGQVANHYQYLESIYTSTMYSCASEVQRLHGKLKGK